MLKSGRFVSIIALWLFFTGVAAAAYAQAPAGEVRKIEYLLLKLGKMSDVSFIRNGKAYSAKEATAHLRMKWKKAGERVKTADDFINLCASRSYLTGQPYRIRFRDGRTEDAAVVLRRLLKERPGQAGQAYRGSTVGSCLWRSNFQFVMLRSDIINNGMRRLFFITYKSVPPTSPYFNDNQLKDSIIEINRLTDR